MGLLLFIFLLFGCNNPEQIHSESMSAATSIRLLNLSISEAEKKAITQQINTLLNYSKKQLLTHHIQLPKRFQWHGKYNYGIIEIQKIYIKNDEYCSEFILKISSKFDEFETHLLSFKAHQLAHSREWLFE